MSMYSSTDTGGDLSWYKASKYSPSHIFSVAESMISSALETLSTGCPCSCSWNMASLASACIPSPVLMACAGPHFHHMDGLPVRFSLPSWTSAWIREKLCSSSTDMAYLSNGL